MSHPPWLLTPCGLSSFLWHGPESHALPLLPHSITQNKSQGQLDSRPWELDSTSWEEHQVILRKDMQNGSDCGSHLWTQSTQWVRSAFSIPMSGRKLTAQKQLVTLLLKCRCSCSCHLMSHCVNAVTRLCTMTLSYGTLCFQLPWASRSIHFVCH